MPIEPPPTESLVESFPPLEGKRARVLVLGTVPGTHSIAAAQYYAHARNAFWPMALAVCTNTAPAPDAAFIAPYADRVARITEAGIAVWDVLARCERRGSLDSAIVTGSEQTNELISFAQRHPELERIVFNGRTSERLFLRHVMKLDEAEATFENIELVGAPSTSPAMAALTLEEKFVVWSRLLS